MKPKSKNKLHTLHQAVIDVIIEYGYQNLSIENILRKSHISRTTLYSYYDSKSDLIGNVFTEVKSTIDTIFFNNFNEDGNVEFEFKKLIQNYAKASNKYPSEAAVMRIFFRNPKIVPTKYFYSLTEDGVKLNKLYSRGVAAGYLKPVGIEVLTSFMTNAVDYIADIRFRYNEQISDSDIEDLAEMSWMACQLQKKT